MSAQGVCKSFNGCWTDDFLMSGSGDFFASGSFGSKLMPPKTIMIYHDNHVEIFEMGSLATSVFRSSVFTTMSF